MAIIVKPSTITNGTTGDAAQVESDFSTLYNDYNGNITNANIAASAAIADSKLAQITTISKVSGTALTSLASIGSAAGIIPIDNLPTSSLMRFDDTRFYVGSFTSNAASTGAQAITGVGFTPKCVLFLNVINDVVGSMSINASDGTRTRGVYNRNNVSAGKWGTDNTSIYNIYIDASNVAEASLTSLDVDGFSINKTKVGSPTGTISVNFLALR